MDPDSKAADEARSRLQDERTRLEGLLESFKEEFSEDGGISQSGDAAAETTSADTRLGMRDSLKKQLDEVDAALQRVEDGTYGVDEVTGEPIDPARLEAEPTARTNVGT